MRIPQWFILWFMLLFSSYATAQQKDIYTSYSTDDGLPQSSVWSVIQDKQGFLWIGTSDGICRFDGYKFTNYRGGLSDSNILTGSNYNKFYCDSNNNLWVISQHGICAYDKMRDQFKLVFMHPGRFNNYNCFLGEDHRYILAGIAAYGIVKIDKRTHEVLSITSDSLLHINSWLNGIICNGEVWSVGNNAHSYIYNLRTDVLNRIEPQELTVIFDYNDSEILAASAKEMVLFKKKDHSYKTLPFRFNEKKDRGITGILPMPGSEIMVASSKGLFYIDTKRWVIQKCIESFVTGMPSSFVYAQCIYRDRSGNIWIGTNGDGLKKLTAPYKRFKHYTSFKTKSNLAKAVYADSKNLYVGYYDNGLDIFNRDSGFKKTVPVNRNSVTTTSVLALMALDSATLIFQGAGPHPIGTYTIGGNVKDISPVFQRTVENEAPGNAHPFFLRRGNTMYTNVGNHCLVSFDVTGPLKPVVLQCLQDEMLSCGFWDKDSALWLGTSRGAFYIRQNTPTKIKLPGQVHVKAISQDNDGNMWLATTSGIYVIGSNKNIIRHYNEANGLSNQFVYGILRDDDDNMWFSHNKGLSVYRAKDKAFKHYERDDGLQSNEFNTGAYFKATDGELFFGGINGVTSFYPREIRENPNAPEVVITSIKLFDMPMKMDTAYWNVRTLNLPHGRKITSASNSPPWSLQIPVKTSMPI
jgi:ligand-binding sensor domain-containing protein